MKKNSITIILIIIIFLLIGYIVHDKIIDTKIEDNNLDDELITLVDAISLEYVDIYLTSDGFCYIQPINYDIIKSLQVGNNLKERLTTLYDRAFYYDIYISNSKLKGYKVKLDRDITKIRKIEIDDEIYIIFVKDNNTIGLFNYSDYYNLLNTKVEDNYNDLKNILDFKNNKIIYLDGSSEAFELKK